jgi:SOS-response transcriptional repressor LexA
MQASVLTWIVDFIEHSGYPPSYRNIMDGFGWTSPNAVAGHLKQLETKKRIRIIPTISRGIIVLRKD